MGITSISALAATLTLIRRISLALVSPSCLLLALFVNPVSAQDAPQGYFGQGHEQWHTEFYSGLKQPGSGASCCNLADCRPTSSRMVGDHYEVMKDGRWIRVPPESIVHITAPDGGAHICAPGGNTGDQVYCVILPPEG